jgi:beta-glucosidase
VSVGGEDLSSTSDFEVRATLRNSGDRDGADVVGFYVTLPDPTAPRRLLGFSRVVVASGATKELVIEIKRDSLASRDPERGSWTPPAGRYEVEVARHVGDPGAIRLSLDI